jgi:tyramine---L-glutamate ligase
MRRNGKSGMADGDSLNVLVYEWVTGGGLAGSALPASLAAEGAAMRRAVAADFASLPARGRRVRVTMTLDARMAEEPGPWTVARVDGPDAFDRVRRLARTTDFTVLIAPETTGVLARQTRELGASGSRLMGATAEAVELTGDKARLAAWLESCGVAHPRTRRIVPALGLPGDFTYPAVLKPIDGAGSLDTYYVRDATSLPAAARAMPEALLQEFVAGRPSSASFLVDTKGQAWLIGIGSQRTAIRDGRFEYLGGSSPAAWRHASEPLRRVVEGIPGLRGFVGVDFIWDPRSDHATVIEVNPRPTTSYVGLCRLLPAGQLAEAWLAACSEAPEGVKTLAGLADLVHRQERLCFDSDGGLAGNAGVRR